MNQRTVPFVSVIMPIRNEGDFVARSLGAVLAQDYPHELMEVIIADGMSNEGTRQIVSSFQTKYSNVRLIDNPGNIVSTGLNTASAQAKGEVIIRVDGHCELAPNYVLSCVKHIENDGVDGVGGQIHTVGETWLAKVIAVAMSSAFGVGGSAFRTQGRNATMLADTVPYPAYKRAIVERAGPYDEQLVRNQDDEYNYRLRKMGAKILLADDVHSRYYSRGSLVSLWRQYFQYGYWKVRVMQKHPRQMRPRQFVPPAFVATLLASSLLAWFNSFGQALLLLVSCSYLMLSLVASVWESRNSRLHYVVLLPLVFSILHISYGFGFLAGLIRFANRWRDK